MTTTGTQLKVACELLTSSFLWKGPRAPRAKRVYSRAAECGWHGGGDCSPAVSHPLSQGERSELRGADSRMLASTRMKGATGGRARATHLASVTLSLSSNPNSAPYLLCGSLTPSRLQSFVEERNNNSTPQGV